MSGDVAIYVHSRSTTPRAHQHQRHHRPSNAPTLYCDPGRTEWCLTGRHFLVGHLPRGDPPRRRGRRLSTMQFLSSHSSDTPHPNRLPFPEIPAIPHTPTPQPRRHIHHVSFHEQNPSHTIHTPRSNSKREVHSQTKVAVKRLVVCPVAFSCISPESGGEGEKNEGGKGSWLPQSSTS